MGSNEWRIKAENLVKRFDHFIAVDQLSVEVFAGEIFGLLGPNGAGKTTSIRMITGMLTPDGGSVKFKSKKDIENSDRTKVGLCPQELVLWKNLTCFEQLIFMAQMYNVPYKIARKRAAELLEQTGLSNKKNKLAKTLSGGMQRRLNLLMGLMHDPEIVILDEPEAGLDPQSRVMVRDFIKQLSETKTVVFTTHNMDEADRLCSRVGIIDHGKLLTIDTPVNLKRNFGKGDKLEVIVSSGILKVEMFSSLQVEVVINHPHVIFQSRAMIDKIPIILELFKLNGISIKSMELRENSLEDVFISLTGRKLRD
ncbi:MAG: ATP-binding cassette domain-containing protein [Prolixibacteraceae bacterium]|nr:ATP-binding cassette domain-containing protein [Prolixibacteraceae bacterium]